MSNVPAQVEFVDSAGQYVPSSRALSGASLWARDPQANYSRVFEVGAQASWMYPNPIEAIAAAMASANPPNASDRVQILIHPGFYNMTALGTINVPSWVNIRGQSRFGTRLRNDNAPLFTCTGAFTTFENFLIEGAPTAGLAAIDCNNQDNIAIREVDMLRNGGIALQNFLVQVGATWVTLLIEHCIIDGWQTADTLIKLQDSSGGAARSVDTHINDCFIDSLHLTNFGGGIRARKIKDITIRGSLIRGANAFHTGVRCENGGGTGCDVLCANNYMTQGVPVFGEVNTNYTLTNTDALGSLTSGTRTLRNSSV